MAAHEPKRLDAKALETASQLAAGAVKTHLVVQVVEWACAQPGVSKNDLLRFLAETQATSRQVVKNMPPPPGFEVGMEDENEFMRKVIGNIDHCFALAIKSVRQPPKE